MRGEHWAALVSSVCHRGSSPHARGAHLLRQLGGNLTGIIPACAGSTESGGVSRTQTLGSSPHARGALQGVRYHRGLGGIIPACAGSTMASNATNAASRGSSPHARGARGWGSTPAPPSGIIPACAGSTSPGSRASCRTEDHPRMRGEHAIHSFRDVYQQGSSPHARGALDTTSTVDGNAGIIPACAGSTPSRSSRARA